MSWREEEHDLSVLIGFRKEKIVLNGMRLSGVRGSHVPMGLVLEKSVLERFVPQKRRFVKTLYLDLGQLEKSARRERK